MLCHHQQDKPFPVKRCGFLRIDLQCPFAAIDLVLKPVEHATGKLPVVLGIYTIRVQLDRSVTAFDILLVPPKFAEGKTPANPCKRELRIDGKRKRERGEGIFMMPLTPAYQAPG
jgi:hypothetical protein